ncbi:MAG: endonuclease III [Anaerolineae bacterium]|nr:endonuclease III [Anaerolineae bacterium]MBT3713740.1 endonuclease III [Anaerolineae bacterium]MBT4309545.1 endonuclease III [Anaerolineae bacterium]MBT4458380.1 endonuclease III [Anaerolineae bacterium]MBT4841215.1 endonuclease III [Anaerolineae bacterium]
MKKKALNVHGLLMEKFGEPIWRNPLPAIDELVSTFLSQNTNDVNRDRAFDSLRAKLPTWEEVRDAPEAEVIEAVRIAGLANQKGPNIQRALNQISEERGELALEFLKEMPVEEARAWLIKFKGVGPKTAAIVLLFSLGMPAFPVDTHVYRITGRVGLRPEKISVEKAHPYLESVFPAEAYYAAHLNIIRLGREICKARKPACAECPLSKICDYVIAQKQKTLPAT